MPLGKEDAMTKFGLGALCLAILTLAACSQSPADPAKAAADKAAAARSQRPAPASLPTERGSDGGGGGY